MGLFDALSRKSAIQGEPLEAGQWRALGTQLTHVLDLFVLRPQSDPAKKFLKGLNYLRERFEKEVVTASQFDSTASSLEELSAEFAIGQRQEIEALIGELGTAVSETLEKFAGSIDAAGKPIAGMEQVRKGLAEAQQAPSLDETRRLLSQGISSLQKLAFEQSERERALRSEYQSYAKRLSARLEQAHEEGRTDALTSLANRRAFEEHMESTLDLVRMDNSKRCLVLMDLDGFKAINDSFGHAAGDAALVVFGNRLRKALGDRPFVARFGGDEFAIESDAPKAVLEGMLLKLASSCGEHPCFHEDRRMTIRFSYGIAEYDGSEDGTTVRKKADAALYAFKQSRKGGRAA
jgi:diguanylate cyclase